MAIMNVASNLSTSSTVQDKEANTCKENGDEYPTTTTTDSEDITMQILFDAIADARVINLDRRMDRWKALVVQIEIIFGEIRARQFLHRLRRFEAVDGAALFQSSFSFSSHNDEKAKSPEALNYDIVSFAQAIPCCLEWDATNNSRYDRHIKPPMIKKMTPGEVGCAMSHVELWKDLASNEAGKSDNAMLILEDDVMFYPGKPHTEGVPGFVDAFACLWEVLPLDWDIVYLGFCNCGPRIPVPSIGIESKQKASIKKTGTATINQRPATIPIEIFRPTYGFYTHAYVLRRSTAQQLLLQLPVEAPLDVWLADNCWFGLNVYCGVIAVEGEGLGGRGVPLISQRRVDSDIVHSAHFTH